MYEVEDGAERVLPLSTTEVVVAPGLPSTDRIEVNATDSVQRQLISAEQIASVAEYLSAQVSPGNQHHSGSWQIVSRLVKVSVNPVPGCVGKPELLASNPGTVKSSQQAIESTTGQGADETESAANPAGYRQACVHEGLAASSAAGSLS